MEHQRVPRITVTKRDEHCCTSGMQNSSVYPKSTRDEPHFPFIGSIAFSCSTEYSTSGLISLRKLQRFSKTSASCLYEYSFQHSSSKKVPCTTYHLKMRADSLSWLKGQPTIPKHLKWSFPSAICWWEGLCAFCLKWNVPQEPWLKRRPDFPQWLKFRLVVHVTRWRDVWIPCGKPRESRRSRVIWTGGNTSLWHLESTWNSMFQKVTMPYSSWKWIGIPISLFQLESESPSPASPPDAPVLSCYV